MIDVTSQQLRARILWVSYRVNVADTPVSGQSDNSVQVTNAAKVSIETAYFNLDDSMSPDDTARSVSIVHISTYSQHFSGLSSIWRVTFTLKTCRLLKDTNLNTIHVPQIK